MAQRIIKSLFIFTLIIAGFSGCYYDNKTELYPASACDTTQTGFTAFVKPKIDSECKVCHSGTSPVGVILLTNYSEISASAKSGKLYGSLAHQSGYKAMPQGGQAWGTCDLQKLKIWINKGAPNN